MRAREMTLLFVIGKKAKVEQWRERLTVTMNNKFVNDW